MPYEVIKIIISAILITGISEIAKRSSWIGAVLASVPLISVLAILWIYWDTRDIAAISSLSKNIFWLVLPSLIFFIALPLLLQRQYSFYLAMSVSLAIMVVGYFLMIGVLRHIQ